MFHNECCFGGLIKGMRRNNTQCARSLALGLASACIVILLYSRPFATHC